MNNKQPGLITRALHAVYGMYVWLVFSVAALFCVLIGIVVPGASRRAKIATGASRSIFMLTGAAPEIDGLDNATGDTGACFAHLIIIDADNCGHGTLTCFYG